MILGYYIIGVIGSEEYPNKDLMFKILSDISVERPIELAIISGGARGPDTWAKEWNEKLGQRRSFTLEALPPRREQDHFFLRNVVIAELADELIAFIIRDKYQDGSWNTINHFRRFGKTNYKVYDENGEKWDRKWKT